MGDWKNATLIFIFVSPVPFLLTVVIPAALNVALNFSPSGRYPNIFITRIGIALSGLLILAGPNLAVRSALKGQRVAVFWIVLATMIAGFPAAVFCLSYLLFAR